MGINNYFDIKTDETRSNEEKKLLEQLGIKHHIQDLFFEETRSINS